MEIFLYKEVRRLVRRPKGAKVSCIESQRVRVWSPRAIWGQPP